MEKWYERFNDAGFTLYNESGEATCVHIVRDQALDIDTTGKWIDVISCKKYTTRLKVNERHWLIRDEFDWIIVELFSRITHPKYTGDTHENKYICWKAAHDDIATHREKDHHGEKYIVLCKLIQVGSDNELIPKTDYEVTAFSKIRQKKINYIRSNADELIEKIRNNKKPTLEILTVR